LRGELGHARLGVGAVVSVVSRHNLSACLAELGELAEAVSVAEGAVQIAEALDHPWSRTIAYWAMASVDLQRGDLVRAIATSARGLDLAATHVPFHFPTGATIHGYALALSGRAEDGIPLMERGMEMTRATRLGLDECRRQAHLSEAYLIAGRAEAARDAALRGLEFGEQ